MPDQPPIALTDEQMNAVLAASHALPPHSRVAFLEACAHEPARLPGIGDRAVHRPFIQVQRRSDRLKSSKVTAELTHSRKTQYNDSLNVLAKTTWRTRQLSNGQMQRGIRLQAAPK